MKPQKDKRQTAAGVSHDLIQHNELTLSWTRNLQFSLCISLNLRSGVPIFRVGTRDRRLYLSEKAIFTTNQH